MRDEQSERFVNNMDWNLLRTFFVIVEEGSITAAAQKLLVQQPAVSLALKRLETQLGARLIDRGRGVFRVTAAGRSLFQECMEIYRGVARMREIPDVERGEIRGEVQICLASHVATPLLDQTLTEFHQRHPRVNYQIRVEPSVDVARNVAEKAVSFGVCLVSQRLGAVTYKHLYREFFGFYCGPKHPLFGATGLTMADLRGHSIVSFDTDDPADALHAVAELRQSHSLEQPIVGYSRHLEEVKRMILCGLGIGPLPVHVVRQDMSGERLWRLPPYDNPPAVDIFLLTNPGKRHSRAEAEIIADLIARVDALPLEARTYS